MSVWQNKMGKDNIFFYWYWLDMNHKFWGMWSKKDGNNMDRDFSTESVQTHVISSRVQTNWYYVHIFLRLYTRKYNLVLEGYSFIYSKQWMSCELTDWENWVMNRHQEKKRQEHCYHFHRCSCSATVEGHNNITILRKISYFSENLKWHTRILSLSFVR